MGFLEPKNIGLIILAAATLALSIALGVTLNRDNQPQSAPTVEDNNAIPGGPTDPLNDRPGLNPNAPQGGLLGDPNRAAVTIDINLASAILSCPLQEGSSQTFASTDLSNAAAVELALSSVGMLCTLTRIYNPSGDGLRENTFVQPIGRSYSGNPWEVSRGKFTSEAAFACTDTSCSLDLNKIEAAEGGGIYQLTTSYDPAQYTKKDIVARFLEQATFGPNQADLTALDAAEAGDRDALKTSSTFSTWVKDQQDASKNPVMSHRAIYRQHLNARFEEPNPLGRTSLPCEQGARYRRITFTEKDKGKKLELVTDGSTKLFKVDGKVRTAFSPPLYYSNKEVITELWYPDGEYRICDVKFDQYTGLSTVKVKHPDQGPCVEMVVKGSDGFLYSNAPIQIHAGANDVVLNIPAESAALIDQEYAAQQATLAADAANSPTEPEIILTTALADAVCADLNKNGGTEKSVIAQWNGNHYIFDPRHHMLSNDMTAPLADGGGTVVADFGSSLGDEFSVMCANTARNFVNEDSCYISDAPNVCSYRPTTNDKRAAAVDLGTESGEFEVTLDKLQAAYKETGAGAEGTVYLYAIDGLSVTKDNTVIPACQRVDNSYSRWVIEPCSSTASEGLGSDTVKFFEKRLAQRQKKNTNPYFLDFYLAKGWIGSCDAADELKKGFEIRNTLEDGTCFRNVHPDHLNVYDFSYWVESHPGNSATRNPISEPAIAGEAILKFPDWHEMDRWQQQKPRLKPQRLRLGTVFDFYKLPQKIRTEEMAKALGIGLSNQVVGAADEPKGPFMVCGSPYEVANVPSLGGNTERSAFDAVTSNFKTTRRGWLASQKGLAWLIAAMTDPGQLRQKAAWALSQIFSIDALAIKGGKDTTENFLTYYDIFVRNAFGNYRDVMKEVSYSPMMAEMLTYYGGRSTAVAMEDDKNVEYADENYAREIMQLFTVGLYTLNPDGTQALDKQGAPSRVYTNDDIEEYARAWTGFIRQGRRGNFEELYRYNQVDPMRIFAAWRDRLPKMGLDRTYIGDGYTLCSDLPPQHFLAQGSTYQLLDSPDPELHVDPIEWRGGTDVLRLVLDANSELGAKLTSGAPKQKIVLDATVACTGAECLVDTIRTVKAGDYYYEYIRTPCVQRAFYNDAKTIARREDRDHVMCGDPLVESATAACCGASESWSEQYFGERTLFATASERCSASLCGLDKQPACTGSQCVGNNYYWTSNPCTLKVKIDTVSGKVGVVHGPNGVADDAVATIVNPITQTFFRVDWEGDLAELASCDTLASCSLTEDGMCLCDVSVTDEQVFSGASNAPPSRQDILGSLTFGGIDPEPSALLQGDTVVVYSAGADGNLAADTVFATLDAAGQRALRKNAKSTVNVVGTGLSFRNPVHFMGLADAEPRDAHQETDATLDQYFYHQNTAPFLAYRFAQRFGISNPSPRYTETIATAFKTGTFTSAAGTSFGSGQYGDLAAAFAAVLLDREARDFALDMDPSHGSLKEPLIKVVSTMRALGFDLNDMYKWVEFNFNFGETIGQMAHQIPSVFSFFLPEYQSSGPVSQGDLVAPEAQVLTGPRIIDTLNGIFAMLKYGLNSCLDGFGPSGFGPYCSETLIGSKAGVGGIAYVPSTPAAAVDELATLLTAGRLSPETRSIVEGVYSSNQDGNEAIRAQMLISATPEFHATGISQPSGAMRAEQEPPAPSDKPYKAVVYILLTGGYDSWNTLIPAQCTATNAAGKTVLDQYLFERTTIAMTEEERSQRVIDAAGQACEQFAVHPQLEILERLYDSGDLAFFANAGQLDAPVTKDDYFLNTRSQLFAHNTMQEEAQRLDPWDTTSGTGILGRMCDVLKVKGYNPQPITVQDSTVATVGVPGASVDPLVVALKGPAPFARGRKAEKIDMKDYVASLNNATQLHTSVFGETWSVNLQKAISDSELLTGALDRIELSQEYPEDETGQQYMRTAKTLASLMMTHKDRGADRDVLFATLGGWDMHANVKEGLDTEFQGLNAGLSKLESELKAQGLWDQVTVVVGSDFGRTLTANSNEGSDHAWGGHYFMFGGSVKGGQILGEYPPDMSTSGPVNIGRGRIIPTTSWESIFTGPLQWMGLDTDEDLNYAMPNRLNTGAPLYTADQVFKAATARRLRRSQ